MTMSNTKQNTTTPKTVAQTTPSKPNDKGNVTVQAHMKIFDPKTKEVYVEGRA